jgi:hypothetical protein
MPRDLVEKKFSKGQEGLFALTALPKGTLIHLVTPVDPLPTPSRWTIQLSEHAHCR